MRDQILTGAKPNFRGLYINILRENLKPDRVNPSRP
jgi:hypothetical protein